MIAVIQCAGSKRSNAGALRDPRGRFVLVVAHPRLAPADDQCVFAHPDDESGFDATWRDLVVAYNERPDDNPLGLLPAYELYENETYRRLAHRVGLAKTYILSAGWGLLPATFLTPQYDITFSNQGGPHARRGTRDRFNDLSLLPVGTQDDIVFFGSKAYVPLFETLTQQTAGRRIVFFNTAAPPQAAGCELVRFETNTRTNWQYECANAFLDGRLS